MMRILLATVCFMLAMIVGCEDAVPPPPPRELSLSHPPSVTPPLQNASSESTGTAAKATLPKVTAAEFRKVISSHTAQGKVVLVDVWATWCEPCIEMFPDVHHGVEALGDDVVLLTLTIDAPADEAAAIEFLQKQHAMEHAYMAPDSEDELLLFQQTLGEQWDSLVVPALFVYGPDDKIAREFQGNITARQIVDGVAEVVAANK